MYNSPMKQSAPFLEMTRAICRLLHGENRRLFGSCPSLAREYMMKLPAFPPGEHCAESGSCWEDQKKITIIIIIVIITIIIMMMIKKTNHTLPFTKSVDWKISSSNVLFALRGVPAKAFKPWPTSTNIIHRSSIISLP